MSVLVTGGGGFLGTAIVKQLRARGEQVRSLARNHYPHLEMDGVTQIQGDLCSREDVLTAANGCHLIFHVAAKAGVWGSYDDYFRINVIGTQNVLAACDEHGIQKLVYTSSPSVVFDGSDQENVDETQAYPKHFLAHYPRTKAEAEALVNQANGPYLATVSLRPHLIWGPGDNHLVPRIIERGRAGKIRFIGYRENKVDSVYVDNAAEAHLLAADRLGPGCAIGGKNYFITNDEPVPIATLINGILKAGGLGPEHRRVPESLAFVAGSLMEFGFGLLGKKSEPVMTRFVARQLATAHWFNIDAAKKDLGYQPKVSIEEGLMRLAASLQDKS